MSLRRAPRVAAGVVLAATLGSGAWAAPAPPDRQAPTKPSVDGPRQETALRPVFTFGATDRRTPRGKLRFRCAFDGSPLRPCARIHRPSDGLALGGHTLRVRALDLAGNASRVTSFSFRIVGVWEAERDFERAPRPANPGRDRYGNTTWFYLYGALETAHQPDRYTVMPTFWDVSPAFDWETWTETPNWGAANVGFNNGKIVMQPGPPYHRQNSILAWRSPLGTGVLVQASIELQPLSTCSDPGNGIVWSFDQGNRTLLTGTLAPAARVDPELTTTVAAGDWLYFVVEDKGDTQCDTTGVQLRIETT